MSTHSVRAYSRGPLFFAALLTLAIGSALAAPMLGVETAIWIVLALIVATAVVVATRYGAFSPISIIYSCSALYAVAPGIGVLTDVPRPLIDQDLYTARALPLALLYFIALLVMYEFQRKRRAMQLAASTRLPNGNRMLLLALGSVMASLLYLYSISRDVGLTVARFDRGTQQMALTTVSAILVMLAAAGCLYGLGIWSIARQAGRKYPWVVFVLLLSALAIFAYASVFILGDRRIFLSILAGLVAITNVGRRTGKILLLMLLPVYLTFSLYSAFRGAPIHEWGERYQIMDVPSLIDPSQGEFGGWARIGQAVLSRPFSETADLTILKAPFATIPSGLYPDRPIAPSLWYVQTFDPATARRGGAWAFSLVIESYMNFWWFGPILLGSLFSLLIARLEQHVMRCLVLVFVLAFSFRSDLVSLIQQTGWILVFISVFHATARGIRIR